MGFRQVYWGNFSSNFFTLRIDFRLSSDKITLFSVLPFSRSLESFLNNTRDSSLNLSDKNSASLGETPFLNLKGILPISLFMVDGKYFFVIIYIKNGDNKIIFVFATLRI